MLRRTKSGRRSKSSRRVREEPNSNAVERPDRNEGYVSGGSRSKTHGRRWTRSRRNPRAMPNGSISPATAALTNPSSTHNLLLKDAPSGYWPYADGTMAAPSELKTTATSSPNIQTLLRDQGSPSESLKGLQQGGNSGLIKGKKNILDGSMSRRTNHASSIRRTLSAEGAFFTEGDYGESDNKDDSDRDEDDFSFSSVSSDERNDLCKIPEANEDSGSSDRGREHNSLFMKVNGGSNLQMGFETSENEASENSENSDGEDGDNEDLDEDETGFFDVLDASYDALDDASPPKQKILNSTFQRPHAKNNRGGQPMSGEPLCEGAHEASGLQLSSETVFGSLGSGPDSTRLGQIDLSGDASALISAQKHLLRIKHASKLSKGATVQANEQQIRLTRREVKRFIRECRDSPTLVSIELSLRKRGLTRVPALRNLARDKVASNRIGILDLDRNLIRKFPSHILTLANLTELHIDYNQLTETSFPASMSTLRSLTLLSASHNHIREFPRAFVTLPALEYLDLRDNDLERLVPEQDSEKFVTALFGSLGRTLKFLDIGMNNLQGTLDVRFCEAILKIEQLSVHTNQLSALPECFKFMDNLRVLRASGNLLLQVPPMSVVSKGPTAVRKFFQSLSKDNFRNTEEASGGRSRANSGGSLSQNRGIGLISGIDESDLEESASHSGFPSVFGRSNSMRSFESTRAEIGLASRVVANAEGDANGSMETSQYNSPEKNSGKPSLEDKSKSSGNSSAIAPNRKSNDFKPLVSGGLSGLLDTSQLEDASTPGLSAHPPPQPLSSAQRPTSTSENIVPIPPPKKRRNFKVVVLGNSAAGKSSLIRTLISGCSETSVQEDRTFGVDIHTCQLRDSNDKVETLAMWDFAGQHVYYRTHQIFLSRRTLYLLVWDVSKHTEAELDMTVCFWVYSVQARVPGAVIQIIASKADSVSPEILEQRKKELLARLNQHETWRKRDLADMVREEELEESMNDMGDIASTMSVVSAKTSSTRLRRQVYGVPNVSFDAQSQGTTAFQPGVGPSQEEVQDESGLEEYHEMRPRILLRQRPRVLDGIIDVSARSGAGFDKLRARLLQIVRDSNLFPHVGSLACIPQTWSVVEDAIQQLQRDRRMRPVCSWAELETAVAAGAEALGMEPVESADIGQCVDFLKDIGHIVVNRSVDMVVLDPNYIVDCIKRIVDHDVIDQLLRRTSSNSKQQKSVAARRVARMRMEGNGASANNGLPLSRQSSTGSSRSSTSSNSNIRRLGRGRVSMGQDSSMFSDVKKLKDKGILSEQLLKCLWHELFAKGRSKQQQSKDEAIFEGLLHILEQFDVCSPLALSSTNERQWIIPCLITKLFDIKSRWPKLDPKCETAIQIGRSFVFPRFKPPGLMEKILTRVSKQFPQTTAEIRTWKDASLIRLLDSQGSIKLLIRQQQERIFSSSAAREYEDGEPSFDSERSVLDICAWGSPRAALHEMWDKVEMLQDTIEDILIYEYMGITWFYLVRCPVCLAHLREDEDFSGAHAFHIRDVEEKQERQVDLFEQNWRDYFADLHARNAPVSVASGQTAGSRPRRKPTAQLCRTMCDTESRHIPSHECPLMWLLPPPAEVLAEENPAEDGEDGTAEDSELDDIPESAEAQIADQMEIKRDLASKDHCNLNRPALHAPSPSMPSSSEQSFSSLLPPLEASRTQGRVFASQTQPEVHSPPTPPPNQTHTLLCSPSQGGPRGPMVPSLRTVGDYGLSLSTRPDQHLLPLQSGEYLDARTIVRIGVYCDQRQRFLESCSGFVMDRHRGLIVTACHLVTDPRANARKFTFGQNSTKRIIVALFSSQDSLPIWQYEAAIVAAGDQKSRSQPPSFATGARVINRPRTNFVDLLVLRLVGQVREVYNSTGLENSVWGSKINFCIGPPISEGLPLPADLPIANSHLVNIGDKVALVGFPLSRGAAETICMDQGSVQGFSPNRTSINAALFNLEGSSGGPLINDHGQVIGVLSTAVSNSLGVHVAINSIVPLLEQVYSYVTMAALQASAVLEQQRHFRQLQDMQATEGGESTSSAKGQHAMTQGTQQHDAGDKDGNHKSESVDLDEMKQGHQDKSV